MLARLPRVCADCVCVCSASHETDLSTQIATQFFQITDAFLLKDTVSADYD